MDTIQQQYLISLQNNSTSTHLPAKVSKHDEWELQRPTLGKSIAMQVKNEKLKSSKAWPARETDLRLLAGNILLLVASVQLVHQCLGCQILLALDFHIGVCTASDDQETHFNDERKVQSKANWGR